MFCCCKCLLLEMEIDIDWNVGYSLYLFRSCTIVALAHSPAYRSGYGGESTFLSIETLHWHGEKQWGTRRHGCCSSGRWSGICVVGPSKLQHSLPVTVAAWCTNHMVSGPPHFFRHRCTTRVEMDRLLHASAPEGTIVEGGEGINRYAGNQV